MTTVLVLAGKAMAEGRAEKEKAEDAAETVAERAPVVAAGRGVEAGREAVVLERAELDMEEALETAGVAMEVAKVAGVAGNGASRQRALISREQKRAIGVQALKSGKIIFDGCASVIDCRVRDLSPTGARLILASVIGVPDRFVLQLEGRPKKMCRIVWRGTEAVGVAFQN